MTIVVGSGGSGKTHLIKYIMCQEWASKAFDYLVVFTMNSDDYGYLDPDYIHTDFTNIVRDVVAILKFQRDLIRNGVTKRIVFDDVIGAINFNDPFWTMLNSQFRHFNLIIVYSVQYINKIPPVFRENAFRAIIFKQNSVRSVNACYESFGQRFFNKLVDFKAYLERSTNNRAFVVVNNKVLVNTFNEVYKAMRAPGPDKMPRFYITY